MRRPQEANHQQITLKCFSPGSDAQSSLAPAALGFLNTDVCPYLYERIYNEALCQAASSSIVNVGFLGDVASSPWGCTLNLDSGKIQFNNRSGVDEKPPYPTQPICSLQNRVVCSAFHDAGGDCPGSSDYDMYEVRYDDAGFCDTECAKNLECKGYSRSGKACIYKNVGCVQYTWVGDNFCVQAGQDHADLNQYAMPDGNDDRDACARECSFWNTCLAFEWYANGWDGNNCFRVAKSVNITYFVAATF